MADNQEAYVANLKEIYRVNNYNNALGGARSYKDFTAEDLQKLPKEDLQGYLLLYSAQRFDLVDQLRPNGMSRADLFFNLNRALAKEGAGPLVNNYPNVTMVPDQSATVSRKGLGYETNLSGLQSARLTTDPTAVTADLRQITLRDAFYKFLTTGNRSVQVPEDIRNAFGTPQYLSAINSHVDACNLAYTVGLIPAVNQKGEPLSISLKLNLSPEQSARISATDQGAINREQQVNYCRKIGLVFDPTQQVTDQSLANAAAICFAQAKIDFRKNYSPQGAGLFGDCTPVSQTLPKVGAERRL